MNFLDLQLGDIVLFTYRFASNELATEIAEVINTSTDTTPRLCVRTISSSINFHHTTCTEVMHEDENATFITKLSSLQEARRLYPEHFI